MAPPASCTTAVLTRINDSVLFASWKDATNTAIGRIVTGTSEATVSGLETDIANTISCLTYQTEQKRGLSTDIAGLQDRHAQTQKDLDDKKAELQIAKERAANLTSPEKKVTIHESWFPLQRPLTTTSFLLILALALFFFCVFLGTLARQFGFFVDYGFQIPIRKLGSGSPWTWFFSQFTIVNIGLATLLITCVGVIIYAFTK